MNAKNNHRAIGDEQYAALHRTCAELLDAYLAEAKRTCDMLSHSGPNEQTMDHLSALQEQRAREDDAHARYQDVRREIFNAAKMRYRARRSTQN